MLSLSQYCKRRNDLSKGTVSNKCQELGIDTTKGGFTEDEVRLLDKELAEAIARRMASDDGQTDEPEAEYALSFPAPQVLSLNPLNLDLNRFQTQSVDLSQVEDLTARLNAYNAQLTANLANTLAALNQQSAKVAELKQTIEQVERTNDLNRFAATLLATEAAKEQIATNLLQQKIGG